MACYFRFPAAKELHTVHYMKIIRMFTTAASSAKSTEICKLGFSSESFSPKVRMHSSQKMTSVGRNLTIVLVVCRL